MKDEYKIVGEIFNGLLIVVINGNAHVMSQDELRKWYGRANPERWNKAA